MANRIETVKQYIMDKVNEAKNSMSMSGSLDEIKIDFSDICTEDEVIEAINELGFEAVQAEGQGVWWVWGYNE